MASNKNQHFVPRCYLRPFTIDGSSSAINLYNIDRQKFIERAALKHQCSGDYFYGKDPFLERAIKGIEDRYANSSRELLKPGYILTDEHRYVLRVFWLLQYLRTEAASQRSVEMTEAVQDVIGQTGFSFRCEIREAVQMAMKTFAVSMDSIADMKICLLRNRTGTPFVTSDDPAVLTNRWHLESTRAEGHSFGLHSAGDILLLPVSPKILCIGFDGDVYSVPDRNGWTDVRRDADVEAFNQRQFLNCRANVFVQDSANFKQVHESFLKAAPRRPERRHKLHYAVLDRHEGEFVRYRVINRAEAGDVEEAMIHVQTMHARPAYWPRQISRRLRGFVFTNGTGSGYVRRAWIGGLDGQPFHKEYARGK